MLLNGQPLKWQPAGLSDSVDGTNSFTGAMAQLANLIPDPSTRGVYLCRAASEELVWGAGAPPVGCKINSLIVIHHIAFFMAAGTGATAAHDIPYAYDVHNGVFIPIAGIAAANTPTTPAATGDWTPPTMCLIGTRIAVTHPGFNTGGGFYVGWIDVTNIAAPVWSAGNTAPQGFGGLPNAVTRSRDGRAYYAVGNAIEASDVGNPTARTNANQVLTIGDSTNIFALGGLALGNIVAGGVVQSVVVFKEIGHSDSYMYQVTGDYNSSWAVNSMNGSTSTIAPLSVTNTQAGLAFISPDGLRLIDMNAQVSDPIGALGEGVAVPFVYAEEPTRMCAAAGSNTLRISVKNGAAANAPWQEYWFNFTQKGWTGPHSFPASHIVAGDRTFFMVPQSQGDQLFSSDTYPSQSPVFIENGQQMTWAYQPVLLPDASDMAMHSMSETNIAISLPFGTQCTVVAEDDQGNVIDQVTMLSEDTNPSIWGVAVWGVGLWGSAPKMRQRQIYWTEPLIFKQLSLRLSGNSDDDVKIGNLYLNFQQLGYDLPYPEVA